jgi:hypothetical protein
LTGFNGKRRFRAAIEVAIEGPIDSISSTLRAMQGRVSMRKGAVNCYRSQLLRTRTMEGQPSTPRLRGKT